MLIALPSCSLLIDTNPDGVITAAGSTGKGKGGSSNAGGSTSGGTSAVGGVTSTSGGASGAGTVTSGGLTAVGAGGNAASGAPTGIGGAPTPGGATSGSGGASTVGTLGGATGLGGATTQGGVIGTSGAMGLGGATGEGTGGATSIGGSPSVGGSVNIGGKANGGATTGGIKSTGGAVTGGTTNASGSPGTGGAPPSVCTGTTNCSGTCVDTATDKANCGSCGAACEGYQFCAGGKCLPTYVSTKILPTIALASSATVQVTAAAVEINKAQGDVLVQLLLTDSAVTMSGSELISTQVSAGTPSGSSGYTASGLARYTASGTLVWGRDLGSVLGTSSQPISPGSVTPLALTSTGDVAVAYNKSDPPPTGPVIRTSQWRLARINTNNANVVWEATYSTSSDARIVVPRSAKNDYVSFGVAPDNYHGVSGSVWQTVDNSSSGTATYLKSNYAVGAAPAPDGATVWLWGFGYGGTYAINPWSTQMFNITTNPSQVGGYDAFIIGVQDNGISIGPWMSEGDWGPRYSVAVDAAGDLIVGAECSGYTAFNGGQDFLPSAGQVLVKVDHATGKIVWRTPITALPTVILAVPGNRIVTMVQQLDSMTQMPAPTAPYQLRVYSGADGSLLSSFETGMMAQALAVGTTELFVLGTVSAATDFNPGTAVDTQGSAAGVYISRYAF